VKKTLWILSTLLGLFLVARAISWPFSVDAADPSSYSHDWGGPTLLGAAAVHCGPGVVSALILVVAIVRGRLRAGRSLDTDQSTRTSNLSER
jgi:hypothetical protein